MNFRNNPIYTVTDITFFPLSEILNNNNNDNMGQKTSKIGRPAI